MEVTASEDTYSGEIDENPCDQFKKEEMNLITFDYRPGSGLFSLYVKSPGPYPIAGPAGTWEYTAVLGDIPSSLCLIQDNEDRMYCDFPIPESYLNTSQPLKLFSNYCFPPIYIKEDVSITTKSPVCSRDLGQNQCAAAGGTFSCDVTGLCNCKCP